MADTLNPFELLGEQENADPEQLAAAKVAAVKPAAKKEEPKAPAKAPAARPDAGRGGRGGRGEFRGRGPPRGGRIGGYGSRPEGGEVTENGYDSGAPAARGRGRGEGRGRGGRGRGAGRGAFDGSRPRREFDRHDGTGRGYEAQKRGGGGRGNWGAEDGSNDVPAENETAGAEEPEKVAAEGEEAPAEEAAEEAAPVEEVKEMSLDEYEAMLAEKKAELNKAPTQRTVDMSEFANLKALSKKDEVEEENPLEVSTGKEKKGPRAKERKEVVTLTPAFKVGDSGGFSERRGRGDRGGRGGGRGRGFGRSDYGGRGDRPFVPRGGGGGGGRGGGGSFNMEESAFPSLA